MDNITQFVFMLHGFAKFNEVQPNIKQWNKIQDEWQMIKNQNEMVPMTFQDLIVAINNVEQVPTSAQWRDIKSITESTIDQLRMEVDLDELYASRMDDDIGCYEIDDEFLPEAHYEFETRMVVAATELKIDPTYRIIEDFTPFTISVIGDVGISHEEISIIDDFIANSYKQKQFDF